MVSLQLNLLKVAGMNTWNKKDKRGSFRAAAESKCRTMSAKYFPRGKTFILLSSCPRLPLSPIPLHIPSNQELISFFFFFLLTSHT